MNNLLIKDEAESIGSKTDRDISLEGGSFDKCQSISTAKKTKGKDSS